MREKPKLCLDVLLIADASHMESPSCHQPKGHRGKHRGFATDQEKGPVVVWWQTDKAAPKGP